MPYAARSVANTLTLHTPQAECLAQFLDKVPTKGSFVGHKLRLMATLAPQIDTFNKAKQQILDTHADQEPIDAADPTKGTKARVYIVEEGKQILKFTSPEQQEALGTEMNKLLHEVQVIVDLKANPTILAALVATDKIIASDDCPLIENGPLFYEVLCELAAALAK